MIIKQLKVGLFEVFCYILGCEKTMTGVIIDPGGDTKIIIDQVEKLKLKIPFIINTHFHPDHTLGNKALQKKTGASVIMHEDDMKMLNNPEATAYFKREGLSHSMIPDKSVTDGQMIAMGKHTIEVIHTPGHSPGSICLLCENNLFTGDSLFVGAAGRVDVPGGDFLTLTGALEDKLLKLPESTIVWPGHDYGALPTSTLAREKQYNPFLGGDWE